VSRCSPRLDCDEYRVSPSAQRLSWFHAAVTTGRTCVCRLCRPLEHEALDAGDRKLLDDVEQYGWHVVKIMGDAEVPEYAFTVGVQHTVRSPEFAMFGLPLDTLH
jgi:hypothetical protein